MHWTAAQPGCLDIERELVLIEQTPGEIVFLSAADTDLSCVASVWRERFGKRLADCSCFFAAAAGRRRSLHRDGVAKIQAGGRPPVRWASLFCSLHPGSAGFERGARAPEILDFFRDGVGR